MFCIILLTVLHYACMHLISKQSCINYNHYIIINIMIANPEYIFTISPEKVPLIGVCDWTIAIARCGVSCS